MTDELISLRCAAAKTGVAPHVITYAISRNFIPEPPSLNGRRAFGTADIRAIEAYLEKKRQKKEVRECKTKSS